ncbi:MAG: hypothetical protein BWY82_02589 [Verrucomicrobia bacterium ADurb.Bin474]|nr:MAG: hypothetical protein BWY82_02589 [Verrucomicrobia bacterium ADurb.Bin474]
MSEACNKNQCPKHMDAKMSPKPSGAHGKVGTQNHRHELVDRSKTNTQEKARQPCVNQRDYPGLQWMAEEQLGRYSDPD